MFGAFIGGYISQFFANEALREAILGAIAVVMVGTLVIHMWRTGPKIQQRMRERLSAVSSKSSRVAAVLGVFLFTFLMITREGMETALLLDAGEGSEPDQWRACLVWARRSCLRSVGPSLVT